MSDLHFQDCKTASTSDMSYLWIIVLRESKTKRLDNFFLFLHNFFSSWYAWDESTGSTNVKSPLSDFPPFFMTLFLAIQTWLFAPGLHETCFKGKQIGVEVPRLVMMLYASDSYILSHERTESFKLLVKAVPFHITSSRHNTFPRSGYWMIEENKNIKNFIVQEGIR